MAGNDGVSANRAWTVWRRRLGGATTHLAAWAARQPVLRSVEPVWARLLAEACGLLAHALGAVMREERLVAVPHKMTGFDLYRVGRAGAVQVALPDEGSGRTRPVELRLRADQVLERCLALPKASRDYLPTIIDHRLDRLTPWRRDRVVHGHTVVGESDDGATLQVQVALAPRDLVDDLLAALRARGLEASTIATGAGEPGRPAPVRFGDGREARHRHGWQTRFGSVWLAAATIMCAVAVGSLFWAAAADTRRVEAERHLAKARRLIREAAQDGDAAIDPAFGDKRPETAIVVLIDRLATALPETTYLRELALTPGEVRLAGTSADAPALIPLLEKAGLFEVRFTAPVSRGDDRRDTFEITADRAPPAAGAP